jgi:2-polyprenyl-3-methyl-5-hydroxy-6-metoxy-1,4-benzoquinol methylase
MNPAACSKGAYRLEPHPEFGFLQIKPTPSLEDILRYYADEFYSSDYPKLNDSAIEIQLRDKEFYDGQRSDLCANVAELAGRPVSGMEVLDIGCGWGQALLYFQTQGVAGYGFDPVPEAVAYAQKLGLRVVQAGMESMDVFHGRRFDVVTLLNVLEHVAEPVAVVREIKERVLKPDGILVIDVPNEFNAFQLCAQKVHALDPWWIAPPAHLNYFSGTTLKALLAGIGYRVERMEASFPMEMFLLFGHNYVGDGALGRQCHERRMAFERNLRRNGGEKTLREFYRALAELNLGRQIVAYAAAG